MEDQEIRYNGGGWLDEFDELKAKQRYAAIRKSSSLENLWTVPGVKHLVDGKVTEDPVTIKAVADTLVPVEPYQSINPIRPVVDTYVRGTGMEWWDRDAERYSAVWKHYSSMAAAYQSYRENRRIPRYTRWFDKLRWQLHVLLLNWGVIK